MENTSIEVTRDESLDKYVAWYLPTHQFAYGDYPRESIENLYALIRKNGIGRFPLPRQKRVGFTAWQKGKLHQ